MAGTSTSTFTELGTKYVLDRDAKGNAASNDVTSATGVIYLVEIDNEANSSAVWLKVIDAASGAPNPSTANGSGTPHYSFIAPAYTKICYVIPSGAAFDTGLSFWCTTAAAVGTNANAGNPVVVKFITT